MFIDLRHLHSRPVGEGTKEILGLYIGAGLKWVRVYPSIFLKKGHILTMDRNQLYDVEQSETALFEEKSQIATLDPSLNCLIVFGNPKRMLPLRKGKKFAQWEAFCGSIVRRYYLFFPRGIFKEVY